MRRYYIVSGILLILSTIDFAIAAPVLVQEKRQTGVDVMHIPRDVVTMLGKRVDKLDELFNSYEAYITRLEESPSSTPLRPDNERTNVKQQLPSIPEMEGNAPFGPSSPASSSMSDADHKLAQAHALPNPKPLTESSHGLTGVHAPLSSQVFPTWFPPDREYYGLTGAFSLRPKFRPSRLRPSTPKFRPSSSRPSTEVDSTDRLVVEEPPSRPASPTGYDADNENDVVHPPSKKSRMSVDERGLSIGESSSC